MLLIAPADLGFSSIPRPAEDTTPGSGSKVYYSRAFNSQVLLVSPQFDGTGITDMLFNYNYYWYPRGENGDSFALQVSNDDGQKWTNLKIYTDEQLTPDWVPENVALPSNIAKTDEMRIRFVINEGGQSSCMALIDDFEIADSVVHVSESEAVTFGFLATAELSESI